MFGCLEKVAQKLSNTPSVVASLVQEVNERPARPLPDLLRWLKVVRCIAESDTVSCCCKAVAAISL